MFAAPFDQVHFYALADLEASAWRNGGGLTREVVRGNFDAGGDNPADGWDWRISIAEILKEGPFSTFPGIDRTSALVHGNVRLDMDASSVSLSQLGQVAVYPGEAVLTASVDAQGAQLLNAMVRRGLADVRISLHPTTTGITTVAGTRACVFVADGNFSAALKSPGAPSGPSWTIGAGQGLFWTGIDAAWDLTMLSEQGCLIHIDIRPNE